MNPHLKLCKSNAYEHVEHHKTKYCLSILKMRIILVRLKSPQKITPHMHVTIYKNSKFSPPQKNRPTNVGACAPGFRLKLMDIMASSTTTSV